MVRPVEGQIEDLLGEIRTRIDRGERALVTTLTVKMAEDLTDYLEEHGVKTKYMHHEVDTFERMEIIATCASAQLMLLLASTCCARV